MCAWVHKHQVQTEYVWWKKMDDAAFYILRWREMRFKTQPNDLGDSACAEIPAAFLEANKMLKRFWEKCTSIISP